MAREVRITRQRSRLRVEGTPILSVMLGSMTVALPIIAQSPVLPPFGLLMLLGWRLLRPDLWPVWMALPLGLFDDIMSGQPLGSAMFLWTVVMLGVELGSSRIFFWRDYLQDWLIAAISISLCIVGGFYFARLAGGGGTILLVLPQIMWSILFYPAVARLCAVLDRWRLPS